MNYAYTNIKKNLKTSYFWENFFKKLFSGRIKPKENLRICIKNSLKRTNRYKLIKILKNIIRYDYIQTSPRVCRNVKIDKVIYSSHTGTL